MIRPMTLADLDEVSAMEERIFSAPWPSDSFVYELSENPYSILAVLEVDGRIAGYAGLWILFDQAQITTLGVDEPYRRHGYGEQLLVYLLDQVAQHCEMITLEVRVSNEAAQRLYTKYGFEILAVRPGYYQDNHENAFLMGKALGGGK